MTDQSNLNEQDSTEQRLLQRWSRRKRGQALEQNGSMPRGGDAAVAGGEPECEEGADPRPVGERLDPRTGRRIDDLTDEDMPALETLEADSDLSCFWSRGVSESLRNAALRRVFCLPKYNVVDTMCEYSGDYTRYEPLGDVVTHDMKRQIARLAKRREEKAEAAAEAGRHQPAMEENAEARDDAGAPIGEEGRERSDAARPEDRADVAADAPPEREQEVAFSEDRQSPGAAERQQ